MCVLYVYLYVLAVANAEILVFNYLINISDELGRTYKKKTLSYFLIPYRYFLTATAKNIK
jgi:hypothetical protein